MEGGEKGRSMLDPTEDHPGDNGDQYEGITDEPFEEEGLAPEEAERRIRQFVTSAEELPGPPSRNSPSTSQS